MIEGELGSFLRTRREALRPADVGLPTGDRRRTPGLRRAEVATLAGISVDYLIRIEQGRDSRPSPQVLGALARVLQLSPADIDHLQQLAVISNGTELVCQRSRSVPRTVRPTVRAMLDSLDPSPAVVLNHLSDVLAWNDAYERVVRPLGLLDDSQPNVLLYVFGDPRAREAYADWDAVAEDLVASLHEARRGPGEASDLADYLVTEYPEFASRWERKPVGSRRTGTTGLRHPDVGDVWLAFEAMQLADDGQRLLVHLPADADSAAALDRLVGRRPGGLKAVDAG
ncbi:helix-turn-helix transcriptional regulator [Aeromicrobium ginsengisoli]|uniref:Helix-turn-helix domain-containing protein n=1 Tax=Aeromicrobium ginsengisoli TaxID=363867 RepID=A0A5M4FCK2_9ACTN|nr:helix-turn-helix transcriptional regulator [Aeromicrobium ginsengisoli]KAA1395622.1 helix-turn-helix domain-containing protein [Aeromicrobium ginsengisoli]